MLISVTQKLHHLPVVLLQLLILSMLKSEKVVLNTILTLSHKTENLSNKQKGLITVV